MKTPNKMIGGIAGAMAQQPGVLGGTTNLGVQPQPGAASVAPQQPPSVFNNNENLAGQKMFGQNVLGQYDKIMSPLGKKGPIKEGLKALAYAAMGGLAPFLNPKPTPQPPPKEKIKEGHASIKSLTALSQYNDQLRREQAKKKTFTKKSREIEKVPRKKVKAVSAIKPAGIQTSATEPTASVEIKNK